MQAGVDDHVIMCFCFDPFRSSDKMKIGKNGPLRKCAHLIPVPPLDPV